MHARCLDSLEWKWKCLQCARMFGSCYILAHVRISLIILSFLPNKWVEKQTNTSEVRTAHIHLILIEIEKKRTGLPLWNDAYTDACRVWVFGWIEQYGNEVKIKYIMYWEREKEIEHVKRTKEMRTVSKIERAVYCGCSNNTSSDNNGYIKWCLYSSFNIFKCRSSIECVKSAVTQ